MYRTLANIGLCLAVTWLAACSGTTITFEIEGDLVIPGILDTHFYFGNRQPVPGPDEELLHCGQHTFPDGRVINFYCNEGTQAIYAVPADAPDRWIPLMDITSGGIDLPGNVIVFEWEDRTYAMMALPDTLMTDTFDGTAEQLLAEHGVSERGGSVRTSASWSFDPASGILDVRFGATSNVRFPDQFLYNNQYETIGIRSTIDGAPTFVYQRVVGQPGDVLDYLETLGGDQVMEAVTDILLNAMDTSPLTG